jgi:aspartokinase
MTNIAKEVKRYLDKSPCIRRNLDIDLINISALARRIINEQNLDKTAILATISAIRRYKLDYHNPIFDKATKILQMTPAISTKGRLVSLSFFKESEFQELLTEICSIIDSRNRDVFRIIQSEKNIVIIVEEENLKKLKSFFQKHKNYKIYRNIVEIKLNANPIIQKTSGIIALLTTELAISDINIVTIMGFTTELLLYVEEKDLIKALDVLHKLCLVF